MCFLPLPIEEEIFNITLRMKTWRDEMFIWKQVKEDGTSWDGFLEFMEVSRERVKLWYAFWKPLKTRFRKKALTHVAHVFTRAWFSLQVPRSFPMKNQRNITEHTFYARKRSVNGYFRYKALFARLQTPIEHIFEGNWNWMFESLRTEDLNHFLTKKVICRNSGLCGLPGNIDHLQWQNTSKCV